MQFVSRGFINNETGRYSRWPIVTKDHCISPREPHAQAWGPSSFHTKFFRIERTRLKTVDKNTDSL